MESLDQSPDFAKCRRFSERSLLVLTAPSWSDDAAITTGANLPTARPRHRRNLNECHTPPSPASKAPQPKRRQTGQNTYSNAPQRTPTITNNRIQREEPPASSSSVTQQPAKEQRTFNDVIREHRWQADIILARTQPRGHRIVKAPSDGLRCGTFVFCIAMFKISIAWRTPFEVSSSCSRPWMKNPT